LKALVFASSNAGERFLKEESSGLRRPGLTLHGILGLIVHLTCQVRASLKRIRAKLEKGFDRVVWFHTHVNQVGLNFSQIPADCSPLVVLLLDARLFNLAWWCPVEADPTFSLYQILVSGKKRQHSIQKVIKVHT
jgi:hypothetical protein